MKRPLTLFFIALLIGTLLLLIMQNNVETTLVFIVWRFELPLYVWILFSFLIGTITSILLALPRTIKKRKELKQLKKNDISTSPKIDSNITDSTINNG